ncbi:hypothetical protein SCHPADRAFT_282896 [Schizopora paradoxa]|uniref:Uncharacterized protein n=1 Tax=Schizopora paradoxa TaxID=27342 RepID=A0A0H2RSR5_9AGAM|nr:hypothetical protein SCHPADRAFT_282896 [Schizopora paradoxa]
MRKSLTKVSVEGRVRVFVEDCTMGSGMHSVSPKVDERSRLRIRRTSYSTNNTLPAAVGRTNKRARCFLSSVAPSFLLETPHTDKEAAHLVRELARKCIAHHDLRRKQNCTVSPCNRAENRFYLRKLALPGARFGSLRACWRKQNAYFFNELGVCCHYFARFMLQLFFIREKSSRAVSSQMHILTNNVRAWASEEVRLTCSAITCS